jgi:hypothetical protein
MPQSRHVRSRRQPHGNPHMFATLLKFVRLTRSRRQPFANKEQDAASLALADDARGLEADCSGLNRGDKTIAPAKYPEPIWCGGCCG